MDCFYREFVLAGERFGVALWRGIDGMFGDVTLPSAAEIPISFDGEETMSRLTARRYVAGTYANIEMIRSVPEVLSLEVCKVVRMAMDEFRGYNSN